MEFSGLFLGIQPISAHKNGKLLRGARALITVGKRFAYWFPAMPEKDKAAFDLKFKYANILRLRIIAWLIIVFMLILLCIQFIYIGGIQRPEIKIVAPYIMILRLIFIGASLIFIVLSGLASPGADKRFNDLLGSGFILFNLIGFAVLSGIIGSTSPGVASSYIMAVLVLATFIHLNGLECIIIYGLAWAAMSISVWLLQPDWIVAFSAFLNGSVATVLGLVISRVIYINRIQDFLNRQLIEQQKEELAASNDLLKQLTYIDALTGIPNRRFFNEYLPRECKRAERDKKCISLIMIDIDKFKVYNDTFGHQAGDNAMIQVAASLSKVVKRPGDMVARYGGEEFVAVLTDTDLSGARKVAGCMRQSVEELNINNPDGRLTISLGLFCVRPCDHISPEELIGAADRALYQAKEAGGNRICSGG